MAEKPMRLDRFLTEMTGFSRTQAKEAAKKGRITVDGVPVKKTDVKIVPGVEKVAVDGREIGRAHV